MVSRERKSSGSLGLTQDARYGALQRNPSPIQPVKILLKGSQLAEASMHDPVFSPFGTFGDVGGYYMIFLSESCQTATHPIRPKTVAVE